MIVKLCIAKCQKHYGLFDYFWPNVVLLQLAAAGLAEGRTRARPGSSSARNRRRTSTESTSSSARPARARCPCRLGRRLGSRRLHRAEPGRSRLPPFGNTWLVFGCIVTGSRTKDGLRNCFRQMKKPLQRIPSILHQNMHVAAFFEM